MTQLQHVYVTAHGTWIAGAFAGETAQIGIRLAITQADSEPAKGSVFTLSLNGDVVVDSGTHAGTNGILTRTWSARLGPVGNSENADAAWQSDLADDMYAFLNAVNGYSHQNFRWTHVKIAPILQSGSYGAPSAVYTFNTPLTGLSTASAMPPECAIAVTWRAPIIGRRGRGRVYIPGLAAVTPLGTDGTVSGTFRTLLSGYAATLVANLENSPGTEIYGPNLVVMSAGQLTAVRPSEVRVGSHWDVQRRRQQDVPETYTTVAL